MKFQTLSHAGLRVNADGYELLCDPWLVGSCYWRSWWNYPPVPKDLVASLKPDFIYLTHIHWDHFQAPSLRLFSPNVPVIIPYDRYGRMVRDLKAVGRKNVIELKHGERLVLSPKLAIRSYHFSPLITDSAVVIEADGQILLNANDAKLAGGPLRQVIRDYPAIDFCFRSHSSANARSCYHVIGQEDVVLDDNSHYLDAFSLFMNRVKPRYAIPFASNNCLLHEENFQLNELVQTPLSVVEHFKRTLGPVNIRPEVVSMIPGDSWSSDDGFALQSHDYFTNREARLLEYQQRVAPTMAKQAAKEAKVSVSINLMERFFSKLAKDAPWFLVRSLRQLDVLIVAKAGEKRTGFAVNMPTGAVREVPEAEFPSYDARIEFPAIILTQALRMNMFGHAAISKRVHYFATQDAMPKLKRFVSVLDWAECEIIPLRNHFTRRSLSALLPRWRESLLYARTAIELIKGKDLPTIERMFLTQ